MAPSSTFFRYPGLLARPRRPFGATASELRLYGFPAYRLCRPQRWPPCGLAVPFGPLLDAQIRGELTGETSGLPCSLEYFSIFSLGSFSPTSESLRASTRVSPGFALFRHSSPSFGSQHLCSHSNLSSKNQDRWIVRGDADATPPTSAGCYTHLHFHCAPGFATLILAHMLDSLVRVSRRVI